MIEDLRKQFLKNGASVSEIEHVENNFDNQGKLIKTKVPTVTTDYCEIGKHNNSYYLVFVVYSESFNRKFFNAICLFKNIQIYDFIDFKKTLYSAENFDYNNFEQLIKRNKYLQIQFDFDNLPTTNLLDYYQKIVDCFKDNKISIVNQLETNLIEER